MFGSCLTGAAKIDPKERVKEAKKQHRSVNETVKASTVVNSIKRPGRPQEITEVNDLSRFLVEEKPLQGVNRSQECLRQRL